MPFTMSGTLCDMSDGLFREVQRWAWVMTSVIDAVSIFFYLLIPLPCLTLISMVVESDDFTLTTWS